MRTLHFVMRGALLGLACAGTAGCYSSACEQAFPGEACPDEGAGGATASTHSGATTNTAASSSSTGVSLTCVPSEATWTPSADCGVFVRTGGTGNGTPDAPFGSVLEALAAQRPIYIAEGEYEGAITLASGTVVFGGLKADWAFDATVRPTITAAPDEIPVTLEPGASTTELHHLKIEARSAELPGRSSIAMVIAETPSLLESVDLVAGDGETGASSTTPTIDIGPPNADHVDVRGLDGAPASVMDSDQETVGPPGKQNPICGTSVGGKGGNGGSVQPGMPATPQDASAGGTGAVADAGCMGVLCGLGSAGHTSVNGGCQGPGQNGQSGADGMPGLATASLGALSTEGYLAPPPDDGMDGMPGQGGGGGGGARGKASSPTRGASGGSGGAGGCGGHGAPGGQGGGSSIALVVLGEQPSMIGVALTVGSGGDGGVGADGQFGATGGNGGALGDGTALGLTNGCIGGGGGKGGNGGHGAGGRGGHSIGIAYNGTAPTGGFTLTAPGLAGEGGMSSGNIGTPGVSAEVLDFVP